MSDERKSKTEIINIYLEKLEVDEETRKEAYEAYYERINKIKEAKSKADSGDTVLDSVTEEVLVKLAGKFIGQNDGKRLTKLLELVDELDQPVPETEKKPKEDSFLRNNKMCGTKIDGNMCIDMISNCLFSKDASACITKWNSQDWSKEIDVANMDGELAYELATKIGLVNSSVADLIKAGKIPSLNSSTTAVLNAIRKRISPNHNDKPIIGETYGVQARLPTIVIAAGQMGGGTNTQLLRANIIRKFDNLNINLSMNGGYYHTSATVFRANLEELSLLLQKQGREIDSNDKKELLKMIGSLERTEIRISKASKYIDFLTKAIKAGKIDIVAETKEGKIVTAKILEDLYVRHEESTKAGQKKVISLMGVLTGLEKLVTKDQLDSATKELLEKLSTPSVGAASDGAGAGAGAADARAAAAAADARAADARAAARAADARAAGAADAAADARARAAAAAIRVDELDKAIIVRDGVISKMGNDVKTANARAAAAADDARAARAAAAAADARAARAARAAAADDAVDARVDPHAAPPDPLARAARDDHPISVSDLRVRTERVATARDRDDAARADPALALGALAAAAGDPIVAALVDPDLRGVPPAIAPPAIALGVPPPPLSVTPRAPLRALFIPPYNPVRPPPLGVTPRAPPLAARGDPLVQAAAADDATAAITAADALVRSFPDGPAPQRALGARGAAADVDPRADMLAQIVRRRQQMGENDD